MVGTALEAFEALSAGLTLRLPVPNLGPRIDV
jgi:hypothetical protein